MRRLRSGRQAVARVVFFSLSVIGYHALRLGPTGLPCRKLGTLATGTRRHLPLSPARTLQASWIDQKVSLTIPASSEAAFRLYSDLRRQPQWSPWLKSVEYDPDAKESRWVIQTRGLQFSWKARNTKEVPGQEVCWESTTGLPNRGRVTFEDKNDRLEDGCLMTLTLSYNLPSVVTKVLRLEVVQNLVERTLLSDLLRFKDVLAEEQKQEAYRNDRPDISRLGIAEERNRGEELSMRAQVGMRERDHPTAGAIRAASILDAMRLHGDARVGTGNEDESTGTNGSDDETKEPEMMQNRLKAEQDELKEQPREKTGRNAKESGEENLGEANVVQLGEKFLDLEERHQQESEEDIAHDADRTGTDMSEVASEASREKVTEISKPTSSRAKLKPIPGAAWTWLLGKDKGRHGERRWKEGGGEAGRPSGKSRTQKRWRNRFRSLLQFFTLH